MCRVWDFEQNFSFLDPYSLCKIDTLTGVYLHQLRLRFVVTKCYAFFKRVCYANGKDQERVFRFSSAIFLKLSLTFVCFLTVSQNSFASSLDSLVGGIDFSGSERKELSLRGA